MRYLGGCRNNVKHFNLPYITNTMAAFKKWKVFSVATCIKVRHAVAQLIEALRYTSEGHGFDSQLCHLSFS